MKAQLELFAPKPHANRQQACPQCGHLIQVSHLHLDGKLTTEFVGIDGRCYSCTYPPKARKAIR